MSHDVASRLSATAERLTRAERKVADALVADPRVVAFGTVAELARLSGASGASVVRLATRLGFDGYSDLQAAVQDELGRRLRPAAERIRDAAPDDIVGRTLDASTEALRSTLEAVDTVAFEKAVSWLADPDRAVWVIAGDASTGIASQTVGELSMLRTGVGQVTGSPVAVTRCLTRVKPRDVVVALDLRRYDRWVVDALRQCVDAAASVIALTDGPLSPLAHDAGICFVIEGDGVGPFDNYSGAVGLLTALTTGVARSLRASATTELDRIEQAWSAARALTDE